MSGNVGFVDQLPNGPGVSKIDPADPAAPLYLLLAKMRSPVALRDIMIHPVRTGYIGQGQPIDPAELPKSKLKEIQKLAIAAFRAVDCAGLARVDFLMDPHSGKMYVNEINTMPGFTSISMYPKLWEASGLPYPELIDRLIQFGLERYAEKKQNQYSR